MQLRVLNFGSVICFILASSYMHTERWRYAFTHRMHWLSTVVLPQQLLDIFPHKLVPPFVFLIPEKGIFDAVAQAKNTVALLGLALPIFSTPAH